MNKTKKIFVVPYFGKFPNNIQLWLNSCANNIEFDWLLITDCQTENLIIPPNVMIKKSSLLEIKHILEKEFNYEIILTHPYKLCDYRVIYWKILDYYEINYDFWGYCDIDLIFGNLSKFLSENLFKEYDRIYINGHLSLMSKSIFSKYMFLLNSSGINWKEIVNTEKNIGFDEHYGINKIWNENNFNVYSNIEDIADIHPSFKNFSLTYLPFNEKKQIFYTFRGGVFQSYIKNGIFSKREFAYIHLQKRKFNDFENIKFNDNFIISENGFKKFKDIKEIEEELQHKNFKILQDEKIEWFRNVIRFYKKRFLNDI